METSTDKQQIEAAIRRFIDDYNSGQLHGMDDCYAEDLIKCRHGAADETKKETMERIVQIFKEFDTHVDVKNEEIFIAAELAYCRGKLTVTLTPKRSGKPQLIHRRFIEIWRKDNGRWRVCRTMDNVDS